MPRKRRYRYVFEPLGPKNWISPFPVSIGVDPRHYKCPLPRNDADFAILSEVFFGVPLTVETLEFWSFEKGRLGRVNIRESYNEFATKDGYFSGYCTHGYDRMSWFRHTCFGPSVASSLTYQQTKLCSHKQITRLKHWIEDRRGGGLSGPTKPFIRLAHKYGVGESVIGRVHGRSDCALTSGRVDAARAVQNRTQIATGGASHAS